MPTKIEAVEAWAYRYDGKLSPCTDGCPTSLSDDPKEPVVVLPKAHYELMAEAVRLGKALNRGDDPMEDLARLEHLRAHLAKMEVE